MIMRYLQSIEINESSNEEVLPEFSREFPYIVTCAELDKYRESYTPWHWHKAVELFYVKSGRVEYSTPNGEWVFPVGTGGFVNSNVLHTSRFQKGAESNIQLLHLFEPSFLAGEHGSRIETKYILPLTTAQEVEMIPLSVEDPVQADILQEIQRAFEFPEQEWGYELRLRETLTSIWLKLFALVDSSLAKGRRKEPDDKIKTLMCYIQEHYAENISIDQLAKTVSISRRACFRLFQENLHMTPNEYIRCCRLQRACQMLAQGKESITQIASMCGFGTSSYFGKLFREAYQHTPLEYRRKWQDYDKKRH